MSRTRSRARPRQLGVSACLALAAAAPGWGQMRNVDSSQSLDANAGSGAFLELNSGVSRSDNIGRTSVEPVSDTLAFAGFTVDAAHDGTRLDYSANGDLDWTTYLDNTYDAQLLGYLDGQALISLVQDRIEWMFRESYDQFVADPLAPATPDNLQSLSYFTTGPRFRMKFGSAMGLELHGDYSQTTTSSQSDAIPSIDSKRYAGGAALTRSLGQGVDVALLANYQRVEFDNEQVATNFDRKELIARYAAKIARTTLHAELGVSQIDDGTNKSNELLVRLELKRKISPTTTIALHAEQEAGDSADLLRYDFNSQQRSLTSPNLISSGDPFKSRALGAIWQYGRARTGLSLGYTYTKETHAVDSSLDRTLNEVTASIERRMRPTLSLRLEGRYQRETFDELSFEDKEFDGQAALIWQMGRRLSGSLRYDRYDRDSSNAFATATENRYGIELAYRLGEGMR